MNLESTAGEHVLKRRIGIGDAVFFILGNVIGIGIFLTPATVAQQTANPYLFLGLWVLGGLIALAGAMSSAELGIMMPHAGGDYVFLKKTYGLSTGFLYGYISLLFSYTGSIAAMATAVVHYQGQTIYQTLLPIATSQGWDFLLPDPAATVFAFEWGGEVAYSVQAEHLIAVGLVLLLTCLNYLGITRSIIFQKIATIAPASILIFIGFMVLLQTLFLDEASWDLLRQNMSYTSPTDIQFSGMATAMIGIFWTYAGWNVTLYLAEDIKNPERVIPISMIISLGLVTIVYILFCFVLLAKIPFTEMIQPDPGDLTARAWGSLFGDWVGLVISLVIAFLIFGGLNTTILSGSRVYLAMARDGIFFNQARKLHPRFESPYWSLWVQGLVAVVLILVFQSFESLLKISTIFMLFLSLLTISCVFLLRYRMGQEHGLMHMKDRLLYRALGYPYFPAFYILCVVLILGGELLGAGLTYAGTAAALVLFGYAMYYLWDYRRRKNNTRPPV
ncbi:MAG: amino acid permease [Leptospiraceae bacterium]|nr:amino acid permease [Leptospiraceae bacterium]MCB1322611.1 amino acid permease [Leptospiraceae bacterium]